MHITRSFNILWLFLIHQKFLLICCDEREKNSGCENSDGDLDGKTDGCRTGYTDAVEYLSEKLEDEIQKYNYFKIENVNNRLKRRATNDTALTRIPSEGVGENVTSFRNSSCSRNVILQNMKKNTIIAPQNCDFENKCNWEWGADPESFFLATAQSLEERNISGPKFDASDNKYGSFLVQEVTFSSTKYPLKSPKFGPTLATCYLNLSIYQKNLNRTTIRLVGEKKKNTSSSKSDSKNKNVGGKNVLRNQTDLVTTSDSIQQWVLNDITGTDNMSWTNHKIMIGAQSELFIILLEVIHPRAPSSGALIGLDNILFSECYDEDVDSCEMNPHYTCPNTNGNCCVSYTKVCDIQENCIEGDDEQQNCTLMPFGSRCTFEEDWCGWYNVDDKPLEWVRLSGSELQGPQFDHTFKNKSGHYLYINTLKMNTKIGNIGILESVIFNPPPKVHSNDSSIYQKTCKIRFFYHQIGAAKFGLEVQIIELRPDDKFATTIKWYFRGSTEDEWVRQLITLPKNISYKYFIRIIAKKAFSYVSDIAIDDISLTPQCFGLNIPEEELNGYDYWNPLFETVPAKPIHNAFENGTYYEFTSCNVTGRFGPTKLDCQAAYENSNVEVDVLQNDQVTGIQKWIVPEDNFYSLFLSGAGGGKGGEGLGQSRGAEVTTVAYLRKGEPLFIVIGQEGKDACFKTLSDNKKSTCFEETFYLIKNNTVKPGGVREVRGLVITNGAGGGGGATYVFLRNNESYFTPLAVAAGGGGLGFPFTDDGIQHGRGFNETIAPVSGKMYNKNAAGAGGGWRNSTLPVWMDQNVKERLGGALMDGAMGGKACYNSTDNRGDGGYGGGGGGCTNGGSGGGYAGGDGVLDHKSRNGRGGYSFVDISRTLLELSEIHPGYNLGSGSVMIVPAIEGCQCDFKCVALDVRRSEIICICPDRWKLEKDGKTCTPSPEYSVVTSYPPWFVMGLIVTIICMTIAFGFVCFVLYNRYQQKASGILKKKILLGDLQLDRLRFTSDSMMTEYNPNYEFGGVVYTLRDLKDIPREQLRLVKALGQGAFGEVYQGFYRQRPCDTVEMPVAVKTLPEMSTSQAEMDFLMEALIMSKFNHPNIVHFIGVCFDKHPRFIILELLAGGDLKNFLRESRPRPERGSTSLNMKDLILIAVDIAKGCKYLEDNRFIHRDIAARNCLLTTKGPGRVVKIADFGMSRDVYRSDYYRKGGKAMLPIKWMPPEAFLDGIFTTKTDVWSYGVLLWEILSLGYMPYTGCANREVMHLVTSGGRLDPPTNCPGAIYGIMTQCWHPIPEQRPTFATILERLGYCLQDQQVVNAPLPMFSRPPSHEKENTLVRPPMTDDNCLQVSQSSDYLIPNHTGSTLPETTSSVEKLLPENSDGWESCLMQFSNSKGNDTPDDNENPTANSNSVLRHSKDLNSSPYEKRSKKSESTKVGVSLDASELIKKSTKPQNKYSNVFSGDSMNPSYSVSNSFLKSASANKLLTNSEINC